MNTLKAFAIVVGLSVPAFSQSTLTLYHGDSDFDLAPVQNNVKGWLLAQPAVRRKLSKAVQAEKKLEAANGLSDLRDAPGQKMDPAVIREKIVHAKTEERAVLIKELPGMKTSPLDVCPALAYCPQVPVSFHVDDAEHITDAMVALIRPWMLLQKARGRQLQITADPGPGDRLMRLKLEGPMVASLDVRVSPVSPRGFDVKLGGLAQPAEFFKEQRSIALKLPR